MWNAHATSSKMLPLLEALPGRCLGFTRSGKPCCWTASSDHPVAAPLRNGGRFCACHLEQGGKREEGVKQLRLESFFGRVATPLTREDTAGLTQDQRLRIAENRRLAMLRRQMIRGESQESSQDSQPSVPLSQGTLETTQQRVLSQEEQERIAENRRRALEKRRQRISESDVLISSESPGTMQVSSNVFGVEIKPEFPSPAPLALAAAVLPSASAPQAPPAQPSPTSETSLASRSRTPPRRPLRRLVMCITASPPPAPRRLLSATPASNAQCATWSEEERLAVAGGRPAESAV